MIRRIILVADVNIIYINLYIFIQDAQEVGEPFSRILDDLDRAFRAELGF